MKDWMIVNDETLAARSVLFNWWSLTIARRWIAVAWRGRRPWVVLMALWPPRLGWRWLDVLQNGGD